MVKVESVMPQTGRSGVHGPVSTSRLGVHLGLSVVYGFSLILKLFQAKIYNHHDK